MPGGPALTTPPMIDPDRLQGSWYRLALPAPLEAEYRNQAEAPPSWYLRSWLLVLIVFNLLSTLMDIDNFGMDAIAIPVGLTFGVYIPLAIGSMIALHGRPSLSRQASITAANAIVDMAIILNSAHMVPSTQADPYLMLAAIVPFAAGTIVTFPYRHAIVFCGIACVLYLMTALAPPLGSHFRSGMPILCLGLILVPLKIAFSRERDAKRTFLIARMARFQAEALRTANERLTILSDTDALTGLLNRRRFLERLEETWQTARDGQSWLGVIVVDIDWFKLLNDTAGHAAGDQCLIAIAAAMRTVVDTASGVLARYGGEEFAACLPGCTPESVVTVGERMRAAVATLAIAHEGLPYRQTVSVSVGVTAAHGATAAFGVTPVSLLAAADEALYVAKRGGRDKVSCKANVLHVVPKEGG